MKKKVKRRVEVKGKLLGGKEVKEKEVVAEDKLMGKEVKIKETKRRIKS